ncbi:MAG: aminoglycoside phosphotransferase family protein [Rickettsiales bacterium]|jgi:aminoglycoside phosphotransferase|nr:aminoglycoside phosphotransferase family protein [Rickettsiales bacterium]
MNYKTAYGFLINKYDAKDIKFLGAGSDSFAFKVHDQVYRFPKTNKNIYQKEADVCRVIKKDISVEIPEIEIHQEGDVSYAVHKMLMGGNWSWHKFSFKPRKQQKLAKSCAKFLAQLHSVDVPALVKAVPELKQNVPYMKFKDVEQYFIPYLSPRHMKAFKKNYEKIINQKIAGKDMVLVHFGLKGPNSVVNPDGSLRGVFDFCNCGIYERSRDLVTLALSKNKPLYRTFLSEYKKLSGAKVSRKRIMDLAKIEFLWAKRWLREGKIHPLGDRFLKSNITNALAHFYGVPKFMRWWLALRISMHEFLYLEKQRAAQEKQSDMIKIEPPVSTVGTKQV